VALIDWVVYVKKFPVKILQGILVLLGVGALVFLLGEPHLEGRNVHATVFEIYFKDPFLAYAYLASVPFFVALYQAFKALGFVRQGKALSQPNIKALRIIMRCALATIGFAVLGIVFILLGESDDHAGGIFMGLLVILISIVAAAVAAKIERAYSCPNTAEPLGHLDP
jgi:hypothetical protein